MRFGKQMRFVAVREWWEHYFPYKQMAHLLKELHSRYIQSKERASSPEEVMNLHDHAIQDFQAGVFKAMNQVTAFYIDKYLSSESSIDAISCEISDAIDEGVRSDEKERSIYKKIYSLMLNVYELRSYLELNRQAGIHITKKLAKVFGEPQLRTDYINQEMTLFENLPQITMLMHHLEDEYVRLEHHIPTKEITLSRPEIILELHQAVEKALMWKQTTILAKFEAATFRSNELELKPVKIKIIPIIIAALFLAVFQPGPFCESLSFRAQRCIGVVGFASILWATSAVPLWLASLSIIMFGITCQLIDYNYQTVGKYLEQATMSPTVFLTIGGFTIAAALRETEMDKRLATIILKKFATNRRIFLLALSLLNAFIAMWISNITSTMIVLTLVIPTLKQIPTGSDYSKAVLFSIAVGGNLGGMMTPLSSPQNAVTVEAVANAAAQYGVKGDITFISFFVTALPFSLICCILAWILVMVKYKMDINRVPPIPDAKTEFGWRQIYVSIVSLATIVIWISLPFGGDKVFSDFGIVGILPVILFYGAGILRPSQISDLPWNIIFLLMGGNALSRCVQDSGLNKVVNDAMTSLLGHMGLWVSILLVNICVLFIDFFLTHTVSSMITLPLVCGFAAKTGHLELYAMSTCMITTASQILPVSSFPNMCTATLQDAQGRDYVTSSEMIKWGILVTVVCLAAALSIYYGIGLLYFDK